VVELLGLGNSLVLLDCVLLLASEGIDDIGVAGSYSLEAILLIRQLSMFVDGRVAEFSCKHSVSMLCLESTPKLFF
jgi:hypothetical protein